MFLWLEYKTVNIVAIKWFLYFSDISSDWAKILANFKVFSIIDIWVWVLALLLIFEWSNSNYKGILNRFLIWTIFVSCYKTIIIIRIYFIYSREWSIIFTCWIKYYKIRSIWNKNLEYKIHFVIILLLHMIYHYQYSQK